MIIDYKLYFPIDLSARQSISNSFLDDSSNNTEKQPFNEIEAYLTHYLEQSKDAFSKGSKRNFRDSIFQIKNLLLRTDFPEYYLPFQTSNCFNNLLEVFVQSTIDLDENNRLDKDQINIISESAKLLIIFTCHHDCCDFLDDFGFFKIIDDFIMSNRKKFSNSGLPRINQDYAYDLIKVLANFASFEEYNPNFSPSMIQYALAGIYSAAGPEYYKEPLLFLRNFLRYYNNSKPDDQIINLIGSIISALGMFPCCDFNDKKEDLIQSIHSTSSIILYLLAKLKLLQISEFFDSHIDKFFIDHYEHYDFLMLALGYIALNHPQIFERLEISLDDICKGLDNSGDFLNYTYFTIYNVLFSNEMMLDLPSIPEIVEFIIDKFDDYDFKPKYYSFNLICYIYQKKTSLYMENVSVLFFILDNCSLFISENDEICKEILHFLNTFHSFMEKSDHFEEYADLAESFNNVLETVECNREYYDPSLVCNLTPFEIPE